jgi:hypothetical protein
MYVRATLPHDLDAMPLAPGDLLSSSLHARLTMRFNVSRTQDCPTLPALALALKARGGET